MSDQISNACESEPAKPGSLERMVSLRQNTVWRDSQGRITVPGCLTAVTATTEQGNVWDVSTETFRLKACIGRQPKQANNKSNDPAQ